MGFEQQKDKDENKIKTRRGGGVFVSSRKLSANTNYHKSFSWVHQTLNPCRYHLFIAHLFRLCFVVAVVVVVVVVGGGGALCTWYPGIHTT